ncbi:hypothetical protein SY89_03062 [Halolamina pelagica]|uniref:Uncharacterized protein n=1 Tax=Halolamina pelagica TaxID=699431 RepID=A0A0P7GS90_9EURY|nr:hypothetical protein [Halolamina pelagica]KPN32294.1 hypothetical protein SY89_03062 [Halolamina pelagica]
MSVRGPRRSRPLRAYFRPRLPDRVERLLFDSGRPGRPSFGERLLARLDELLIVVGLRLLAIALFVDLVTGEFLALTAFNVAISLPVFALATYQFVADPGHGMLEGSLRSRLRRWRRDREWYSKRRRGRR